MVCIHYIYLSEYSLFTPLWQEGLHECIAREPLSANKFAIATIGYPQNIIHYSMLKTKTGIVVSSVFLSLCSGFNSFM